MPIYEFECRACGVTEEIISTAWDRACRICGRQMKRLMSTASIIIAGNPGPKLRTRVNLDDELQKEGMNAPLFRSDEAKDKARWALKKHSLG
jgi:putative FmdB family regulatory protein